MCGPASWNRTIKDWCISAGSKAWCIGDVAHWPCTKARLCFHWNQRNILFLDFSYQHFFQLGSRQAAFRWRAELYPAKGNGPTSLFSPKQRMLGQPVFHLLSNLAFLRHIRAHYNRNIVPKWARRDHVLAQKVAELDSLLEMSAAGDCAPLEAKLLAISSQGSFQRELLSWWHLLLSRCWEGKTDEWNYIFLGYVPFGDHLVAKVSQWFENHFKPWLGTWAHRCSWWQQCI